MGTKAAGDVGRPRLGPLDALRGIAALIVVLVHLRWVCGNDLFALPLAAFKLIDFGSTGVILFFIISGFSLDLTMPRHEKRSTPLVAYALSRLFRIAPLFYLMIPLTILSDHLHGLAHPASSGNLLLNFGFLFNFIPKHQTGTADGLGCYRFPVGIEHDFRRVGKRVLAVANWTRLCGARHRCAAAVVQV